MNEFEIATTTAAEISFTNKALTKATQNIIKIGVSIAKANVKAAIIAAEISETKAYKDDGFVTAAEWLVKTFGMSKTPAYNLINIGKRYIDKVKMESVLPHETTDYTVRQLAELTPIDTETALEMAEAEEIKPEMTVREIREAVKKRTTVETEAAEVAETEEAETEEAETETEKAEAVDPYVNALHNAFSALGVALENIATANEKEIVEEMRSRLWIMIDAH